MSQEDHCLHKVWTPFHPSRKLTFLGYWFPFAAARALAENFCWEIRYALTPIFGRDFPDQCLRPEHERFGDMIIDPAIIKFCTEEAAQFKQLYAGAGRRQPHDHVRPAPRTPGRRTRVRKQAKLLDTPSTTYSSPSPSASESDTDCMSSFSATPTTARRNKVKPLHIPRSAPTTSRTPRATR